MGYNDIAKVVKKKDGTHPTESSVREAVKTFTTKGKKKAGRPKGSFKTSKEEDKQILTAFHKVRPPGVGVTARKVGVVSVTVTVAVRGLSCIVREVIRCIGHAVTVCIEVQQANACAG